MTTKRDWIFRADYMRLRADHLDRRGKAMQLEAEQYRHRANSAQTVADSMPDDAPILVTPVNQ